MSLLAHTHTPITEREPSGLNVFETQMLQKTRLAVGRGAAIYDDVMPTWFNIIDDAGLEMQRAEDCIAGQLATRREFGHLHEPTSWDTIIAVSMTGADINLVAMVQAEPEAFGLDTYGFPIDFIDLRNLWMDEINERRDALNTQEHN